MHRHRIARAKPGRVSVAVGLNKCLKSFIGSNSTCFPKSFHRSKALAGGNSVAVLE